MHEKFPLWYSAVAMQTDAEKLSVRASAIDNYLNEFKRGSVESLVRLAFGTKKAVSDTGAADFRRAFGELDPSFPEAGNDRELQVLAAMTLARLIEDNSQEAAFAALAVTTASAVGQRKTNLPMDLPGLAESAIRRIATENGTRPQLGETAVPALTRLDFNDAATSAAENTVEGFKTAFDEIGAIIQKDLMALRAHQAKVLSGVEQFVRVQDEELQMLWWVVGGRSELLDVPFSNMPAESRPIVLAEELSGLVCQLPGPPSVRALLSRGGLPSKNVSAPVALKAAHDRLKFEDLGGVSPVTRPLHFGLSRLIEVDGADGWEANWAAVTGLPTDLNLDALDLAELYFREALLQRYSGA